MDYVFVKSTKKGKEGSGTIHARVRTKESCRKYTVGFTVTEKEWQNYKDGSYSTSDTIDSIGIKYCLFANILEQIRQELEESPTYEGTGSMIKSIVESFLNAKPIHRKPKTYKQETYLSQYIAECIDGMVDGRIMKRRHVEQMSEASICKYRNLQKKIREFEEACGEQLTLEDVDMSFQQEFTNFCKDEGLYPNTIYGYMSLLRVIMKYAFEDKLTKSDLFKRAGFVPSKEVVDQVYLTAEQIQEMLDLDISSREKILELIEKADIQDENRRDEMKEYITKGNARQMAESRDIFIAGCLTGQRFSDYSRLNRDMFTTVQGIPFIRLVQEKTRKTVYIPIDIRVRQILKRYHGALPQVYISKVSYNIKLIAELMGWTWNPNFDESRMGKKVGTRFCDMISTHTARRSFATNAYHAGVPIESIMSITGHERESTFRLYLKLEEEEKGIMAARDFEGIIQ